MAKQISTLALLVCALVVAGPGRAAETYDDIADGNWDAAATWQCTASPGSTPDSGDTAEINARRSRRTSSSPTAPSWTCRPGGR